MTMEAEIAVMQPQAKACQQPLEARRGKKWILPGSLHEELVLLAPLL